MLKNIHINDLHSVKHDKINNSDLKKDFMTNIMRQKRNPITIIAVDLQKRHVIRHKHIKQIFSPFYLNINIKHTTSSDKLIKRFHNSTIALLGNGISL